MKNPNKDISTFAYAIVYSITVLIAILAAGI